MLGFGEKDVPLSFCLPLSSFCLPTTTLDEQPAKELSENLEAP
jgi:hypothetical protein